MVRPYLNQLSFNAPDIDTALSMLEMLRKGIACMDKRGFFDLPVMCAHRVSELPLTPDFQILPQMADHQGGRFRETVTFFLRVLDQRAPVHEGSEDEVREFAENHIIEKPDLGDPCGLEEATMALVVCTLNDGVLLSLQSEDRWKKDEFEFSFLVNDSDDPLEGFCRNVSDTTTATSVSDKLEEEEAELVLKNWDAITGNAQKSDQVNDWLEETLRSPGLTQLVLRKVGAAKKADYRCDGNLVKKLEYSGQTNIYQVRAHYRGSNNVRLLFTKSADNVITYRYAGRKSSPNWYDHAFKKIEGQLGS